jgi:hypothetical protein
LILKNFDLAAQGFRGIARKPAVTQVNRGPVRGCDWVLHGNAATDCARQNRYGTEKEDERQARTDHAPRAAGDAESITHIPDTGP